MDFAVETILPLSINSPDLNLTIIETAILHIDLFAGLYFVIPIFSIREART